MKNSKLGFIGAGNMAQAVIGGLLQSGYDKNSIAVSEPNPDTRKKIEDVFSIKCDSHNDALALSCDTIVLAVKPQMMRPVLQALATTLSQQQPLLISIAAGITVKNLESWSGTPAVVRVMPNMPALVQSGAAGLFANANVSDSQKQYAEKILQAVGVTVWLEVEAMIDQVTALSGSGPAYFFYLMEAMQAAAVKSGLPENIARELCLNTALGAAKLALASDDSPEILRKKVSSPGGTTEHAINIMEAGNMRDIVERAFTAARKRSEELGQ